MEIKSVSCGGDLRRFYAIVGRCERDGGGGAADGSDKDYMKERLDVGEEVLTCDGELGDHRRV